MLSYLSNSQPLHRDPIYVIVWTIWLYTYPNDAFTHMNVMQTQGSESIWMFRTEILVVGNVCSINEHVEGYKNKILYKKEKEIN